MHSSLLSISLISIIAALSVADDLFTDWTLDSNLGADLALNPSDSNDASSLFLGDGADAGNQLLAFNDNGASNPFTADSSLQSTDLLDGNQALTTPLSDDMSNWFLDSTPLTSPDNGGYDTSFLTDDPALPDLLDEPFGSDANSPDLLANNAAGGCSSFAPSSRSRRSRKRNNDGTCTVETTETAEGVTRGEFLKKSALAQDAIFRTFVCPSADFGVTVPVCSSPDPLKSPYHDRNSLFNPDSNTLADSTLSQSISTPCEVSEQLTVSLIRSDLERGLHVLWTSKALLLRYLVAQHVFGVGNRAGEASEFSHHVKSVWRQWLMEYQRLQALARTVTRCFKAPTSLHISRASCPLLLPTSSPELMCGIGVNLPEPEYPKGNIRLRIDILGATKRCGISPNALDSRTTTCRFARTYAFVLGDIVPINTVVRAYMIMAGCPTIRAGRSIFPFSSKPPSNVNLFTLSISFQTNNLLL